MKKVHRNRNGRRRRGGEKSGIRILMIIAGAGAMLAALLAISAALLQKGVLPIERASLLGKLAFAAATFLGCWLAGRLAARRKLLYAAAAGGGLLAATCLIRIGIEGTEQLRLWIPALICAASILISGLAARPKRAGYR